MSAARLARRQRTGGAIVEFAVCFPIFFLITMATIETCRLIYLRQSIKIAAYECARLAIIPDITSDVLVDQCDLILSSRRLVNYQLTTVPADLSSAQYGDLITTSIEIPIDDNVLMGRWFYPHATFKETVSIMAEHER
ncbi:MAG: TadE/TadG family type IV pilus assembly protein [Pirellulales bacterium]